MRKLCVALVLGLVLISCGDVATQDVLIDQAGSPGNSAVPEESEISPDPRPAIEDDRPVWGGFADEFSGRNSLVALTNGSTDVYAQPGDPQPLLTMPWSTVLGTVTVLAIVGQPEDGWAQVMLPVRPNGTSGWVRTDDIEIYTVDGRIVVDLSDRVLTYYRNGQEVLRSEVAVGKSGYPTPTGTFFVTDSVTIAASGGPWGPNALGLSARSDTITEFNGGDGIIGIHGTNNPNSIGEAASLGCVRLPNELIAQLHAMVPIGTPVEIKA